MPAIDRYHHAVKSALIKDGWTITADPLKLQYGDDVLYVDLAAERVIAAQKGVRKIAVEVKTFPGPSRIADLENAIGQFVLYRIALRRLEPDRELYLAAPESVVQGQFAARDLWRAFLTDEGGKLIGFDIQTEEIVEWLPPEIDPTP